MKELVFYSCLILLGWVTVEDYKFRAVSWVIFPLLFTSFLCFNLTDFPFSVILENFYFNFFFLFLILLIVTVYFSLKEQRLINISKGFLGWGDILFLLSLCVLFSPLNYMIFYVSTLFFIVVAYLLTMVFKQLNKEKVPLAGLQALMLIALLLLNKFFLLEDFCSDEWIVKTIYLNE